MANYKIQVKIEMVECQDAEKEGRRRGKEGCLELTMNEQQAISIDACEKALLATSYKAMREAISAHLTAVSKKTLEQGKEQDFVTHDHPYQVDGEVGRFTFQTHDMARDGQVGYAAREELFPPIGENQWYQTVGFKEIALVYGTSEQSYRKTSDLIDRIRYQEGATPARTLQQSSEAEGVRTLDFMERKTQALLSDHGFTAQGRPSAETNDYGKDGKALPQELIRTAVEATGCTAEEHSDRDAPPVLYEDPQNTVNISIDDVVTKMQKEVRDGSKPDEKVPKKNFYNTVAHVEHGQKSYVLHATSVGNVLRMNLGFLLNNGLLGYRLQFFVDGQKTLHASIVKAFSWFSNIGLLLDWYHLEEKCKKQLSLGMKGRDLRKQILEAVLALLWRGRVQAAIQALQTLNPDRVKNRHELVVLVNYLDRNRPYIPCYCVRKHLGLRNSSNIGEKMNDLIVSDRQKHNGMSWSKMGSTAQASIEVLKRNHEVASWLQQGDLAFSLAA